MSVAEPGAIPEHTAVPGPPVDEHGLQRRISWTGAFWTAWSRVLVIGSGLAAGYILVTLFGSGAGINSWQITLLHLDFLKSGLTLRINATMLLGAFLLLIAFAIQHRGISGTAKTQIIL